MLTDPSIAPHVLAWGPPARSRGVKGLPCHAWHKVADSSSSIQRWRWRQQFSCTASGSASCPDLAKQERSHYLILCKISLFSWKLFGWRRQKSPTNTFPFPLERYLIIQSLWSFLHIRNQVKQNTYICHLLFLDLLCPEPLHLSASLPASLDRHPPRLSGRHHYCPGQQARDTPPQPSPLSRKPMQVLFPLLLTSLFLPSPASKQASSSLYRQHL